MKVVTCNPGEDAKIEEIENSYEAMKEAVGGWIVAVHLCPNIVLYGHDEALLIGLPWNRVIDGQPMAGRFVVVGSTDCDDRSLTGPEADAVLTFLNAVVQRMEPSPSSIEELEALTGRPAMTMTMLNEDGTPGEEIDLRTGKPVKP